MTEIKLVNFKCPVTLLERVDEDVKAGGYGNRTDFILDALRDKATEVEERKRQTDVSAGEA